MSAGLREQLFVIAGASPSGHLLHARVAVPSGRFRNVFAEIGGARDHDERDRFAAMLTRTGARHGVPGLCAASREAAAARTRCSASSVCGPTVTPTSP